MRFCLTLGVVSLLAGTYLFNGCVWLRNSRLLKQIEDI